MYYTMFFDYGKSVDWLRTTAITMLLSLTLMSFIKILIVWMLPQLFVGTAIIVITVGFLIVYGTCELALDDFGADAKSLCG